MRVAWSITSKPPMDDRLAQGTVWHRRQTPRPHQFRYQVSYSLLDVDRLATTFQASRLWSVERPNLVSFRRRDYLGDPAVPLGEAVRQRVFEAQGLRPDGPAFVLTHLRQWGYCFNPVTFYFCHHQGDLAFIVAEIHNTPWNERHAYVLDCRDQEGPEYRFCFDKAFHVSPFMPMGLVYDWRFRLEANELRVHMLLTDQGRECFTAGMRLVLEPVTAVAMRRMPWRFPLMTLKVVAGIYWQALRLWIKRIPFYSHPAKTSEHS